MVSGFSSMDTVFMSFPQSKIELEETTCYTIGSNAE